MNTKKMGLIRLTVCFVAFTVLFLCVLFGGTGFFDFFGWAVFGCLLMFGLWTAFVWLRERIGRHCYWVIPVFCILVYGVGILIVDAIPGWSGLGAAIAFLYILAILAASVVSFLIEMVICLLNRKK